MPGNVCSWRFLSRICTYGPDFRVVSVRLKIRVWLSDFDLEKSGERMAIADNHRQSRHARFSRDNGNGRSSNSMVGTVNRDSVDDDSDDGDNGDDDRRRCRRRRRGAVPDKCI